MQMVMCAAVLALGIPKTVPSRETAQWTQHIAFHFLNAALEDNLPEALAYTTDGFRNRLRKAGPRASSDRATERLRQLLGPVLRDPKTNERCNEPHTAVSGAVFWSPSGDEVLFYFDIHRGKYAANNEVGHASVVVVRASDGKWRVNSLRVGPTSR